MVSKMIVFIALNCATVALLWLGYAEQIEGARNAGQFIVFVYFLVAILSCTPAGVRAVKKAPPSAAPIWVHASFDAIIVSILVWHGAILAATAYTMACFITATLRSMAEKSREEESVASRANAPHVPPAPIP